MIGMLGFVETRCGISSSIVLLRCVISAIVL